MRIYLEITPIFPTNESFRGSFIYDQVNTIDCSGCFDQIIVMQSTSIWNLNKSYTYKKFQVHLFPTIQFPSLILNGIFNKVNSWLFRKRLQKLKIRAVDITVAHGHTSTFAAYALAVKKINPQTLTIVQHHDPDPFTIRNGKFANLSWNIKYRARKNMELFNLIDLHVSVSKYVELNLIRFPQVAEHELYDSYLEKVRKVCSLSPVYPQKSTVLYNGVNVSIFRPIEGLRNPLIFQIGCIGNFTDWKDQLTLIKAIELLIEEGYEDIRLSLIGTGPLLDDCKTYVNEHQLSLFVKFEKEVHHQQLPNYYNSLDLFVLPSFFEGFGCVFTEAYSCNVPFMTCFNQGISDYLTEEEAEKWLFAPKDYTHLADLIRRYKHERYKQVICKPYDITILIKEFLESNIINTN